MFEEKYQRENINLLGNMIKNKWNKPARRSSRHYYCIFIILNTDASKRQLLHCKWTSRRNRFCSKITWSLENKNCSLFPKYRLHFDFQTVHITDIVQVRGLLLPTKCQIPITQNTFRSETSTSVFSLTFEIF